MTSHDRPGQPRRLRTGVPLLFAGAAMALSACVVPVPPPGTTAERQSSMLASDATCPRDSILGARFEQPVDVHQPNQRLVAEALRKLVNGERCRRGAAPLQLSPSAVRAAGGHARTMAKYDFMGHTSPVGGFETLDRRLRAENAAFGYAAENVARAPATALATGEGTCLAQAAAPGGLEPPTYAEIARGLFDMWIVSSRHAENIFNPRYRQVGAGIGINPQKYRCGEVAAAMVFTG